MLAGGKLRLNTKVEIRLSESDRDRGSHVAQLAESFKRAVQDEADLLLAFYKARALGVILHANNLGLYALPEVEQTLFARMQAQLGPLLLRDPALPRTALGFVITTGYLTGGHTRLMERMAKFCPDTPDLLVTGRCDRSVLQHWQSQFTQIICLNQFRAPAFSEQVLCLAQRLASYDQLVIFIHPEDVFAVVALGLAKQLQPELRVYYVNHADHCFSYGVSVADYWFELSAFGHELDKHRSGLNAQRSFLGIPVEYVQPPASQPKRITRIFTAANDVKFKPVAKQSLMPLIDALLQQYPDAVFHAVGVSLYSDYWWWRLKWRYPKRLQLQKKLPYARYLELTQEADLYIDSHPLPGGTAFVEQYLQGRRCAGLISPWRGYTPLELIKTATPDKLIAGLEAESVDMTTINRLVQDVHGLESVRRRFLDCLNQGICHSNPMPALVPLVDITFGQIPAPDDLNLSRFKPLTFSQSLSLLLVLRLPLRSYVSLAGKRLRRIRAKTYWLWLLLVLGMSLLKHLFAS